MATLRLDREEIEEGELPPFCMRCGAGVEETIARSVKGAEHKLFSGGWMESPAPMAQYTGYWQ